MLSLSSLLNPVPSGPLPQRFSPSPSMSSPATSAYADDTPSPALGRNILSGFKMSNKDSLVLSKSKPRGVVNFYPYETVDSDALREVRRFQVAPFGQILHSCLHIPYNSGKKDFYEKTGRESFEVFKYDFRLPGSESVYTIMWDYNVGLVRMTPFFKCCKYGKTVPAKMLNQNPGLKEITHSITGGSISAQGYWMPYYCAKAVCATFCYEIAGALIPIFGPDFIRQCVPPGSHDFQRMIINPAIIYEAQREADMSRRDYQHQVVPASMGYTSAPSQIDRQPFRVVRDSDRRLRIDTRTPSPYSTDTEVEGHYSGPDSASSSSSAPRVYAYHSVPTAASRHSWTAANHPTLAAPPRSMYNNEAFQPPNPWLSAVPRFAPHPAQQGPPRSQPLPRPTRPAKRPIDEDGDDIDKGYEGGESHNGSPALEHAAARRREKAPELSHVASSERNAALMLLNLSVKDQPREREQTCVSDVDNTAELHRVKRRRAASL